MSDADEQEVARMHADERCWDGTWMADGFKGMMIGLDAADFCQAEMQEFEDDQREAGGKLNEDHEFLQLPPDGDETGWQHLHDRMLNPRGLVVACCVLRRAAEGTCPPRIRIRKLDPDAMQQLLDYKQLGNTAFSKQEYEKAVALYDDALMVVGDNLYVAPQQQIQEVVNVLSNQAECYLRLKKFQQAGDTATRALMFDNGHEKSRLRRAKAALAIAGPSKLIQAQVDLQEIVDEHFSTAGVKEAKGLLPQLDEILQMERTTLDAKVPGPSTWDVYVRHVKSTCW